VWQKDKQTNQAKT